MNIAFISYWSCPLTRLGVLSSGGMNVYVINLANNLGLLGHKVDIYTRTHKENDEKIIETHKNVRIIHLTSKGEDHYKNINAYTERFLDFTQKNLLRYDILHAHYFYSGLIGLKLKEKLAIPLVFTFHALGVMKDLYGGSKEIKRIESEKHIVKFTDAIISSVELERKELVKKHQANNQKIYTVPPGVNHRMFKKINITLARKKAGITGGEKVILFVGRIDPIKGITLLINAVDRLSKKYANFENNFKVLLIGGDINSYNFWQNPEVKKIQLLIEKLDLACCVKFIGAKPHYVLPYYYNASDVVVMPSKYESFGLVVLEAMASGVTVVASKVGGLSYLITDKKDGRFFKSGDLHNLSDIIWELLNDDKRRKDLGGNAIVSSQKYCWDIQAEKVARIYKKLICPVEKFRK